MTHCEYCKRQYANPPESCAGCGAPLVATDAPMLFDPSIISPDAIRRGQTRTDWIPAMPAHATTYNDQVYAAANNMLNDQRAGFSMRFGLSYMGNSVLGRW